MNASSLQLPPDVVKDETTTENVVSDNSPVTDNVRSTTLVATPSKWICRCIMDLIAVLNNWKYYCEMF